MTQTHLEQISANREFRSIAEYFGKVRYYHLLPQVIRDPARAGSASSDPFGGDFIAQMKSVQARTRTAWLRKMETALRAAVPKFESLAIEVDDAGRPHLTAGHQNWRQSSTRQNETEFSDGTLRLIGLLWAVVSTPANGGVLLLEEPELSLNAAIEGESDRGVADALIRGAGQLRQRFTSGITAPPTFLLRVAHSMSEAWLLADRDGFAQYFGVRISAVPKNPESLAHAKSSVLQLCSKSRIRAIRQGMVTKGDKTGPLYMHHINNFAMTQWDVINAAENCDSLARALKRIPGMPMSASQCHSAGKLD